MSNPIASQPSSPARGRQLTSLTLEADLRYEPGNTQFPSLTPGEAHAAQQLLARFDRPDAGNIIGLLGPRSCGKSTLLNAILAPASGRRIRTPDHRKVVGVIVDAGATNAPDGKSPWQHLVLNVLELLASHAMPTERKLINELRSELLRGARPGTRADADSRLAVAAFAHHFRTAYPRLVMNVFTLSNAVLVVGIDHLDRAPAGQMVEWLEAANYFLSAPGCMVVACADEAALIAKLQQDAGHTGGQQDSPLPVAGEALLGKWLPQRVTIEVLTAPVVMAAPMAPPPGTSQHLPAAPRAADPRYRDIPEACMRIITSALQPDRRLIEVAASNWHTAMRAIVKRAEDRVGNAVSSTVIAKLVTLQALSPQLFDAGRYNAQLLVALEQQLRGETQAPPDDDWYGAVSRHPALKSLLTSNPPLSALSLPDLAAALRLTYAGQDAEPRRPAETAIRAPATAVNRTGEVIVAPAGLPAPETTLQPFALGLPAWVSAIVAGGVFIADRLAKLLVIAAQPAALRNSMAGGTATSSAFAVGAELFGVALCALILLFWGGARPQRLYSISLGCILGALASNLFDRLAYGHVLNFIHIANLPVFNLSHVALLAGAILLAVSLLRSGLSREAQPQT